MYNALMLEIIRKEIDKGIAKGMSYPQMAEVAGVHRTLPARWYNGKCVPSVKNFEALKAGIRKFKPVDCVVERMFKECGVNVNFVDCASD